MTRRPAPSCHTHGGVWLAYCPDCRAARARLATVPSGTVPARPLAADQRRRALAEAAAAGVILLAGR